MPWRADANGVLHWVDTENSDLSGMTTATGRAADDRWEDPENSDQGGDGSDEGSDHHAKKGGDNGDNGDSGNNGDNGNNDNGDKGNNDNNDSNNNDNSNNDNSGNDQQNLDAQGNDNSSLNLSGMQDDWFKQQQDQQNNQNNYNQNWQNDFSGRMQSDQQQNNNVFSPSSSDSTDNMDDPNHPVNQAYQFYKNTGISLLDNQNQQTPQADQARDDYRFTSPAAINPYQYSADQGASVTPATTPTTSPGSIFSDQGSNYNVVDTANLPPAPQQSEQARDTYYRPNTSNTATAPEAPPDTAPASPTTVAPPDAQAAATAAANAAAQSGATPQEIATAAVTATRLLALDNQTLDNQSAWTKQMFRSTYGPENADAEWARQHNDELRRNKALYGYNEPTPGTAPVTGAPAGTPVAPNRTIGAVRPPGPNETAMYGSTPVARQQPAAAAPPPVAAPSRPTSPAAPVASGPAAPAGQQYAPTPTSPSPYPAADEYGRTPGAGGATATTATPTQYSPQPAADEYGRTPASGGAAPPGYRPPTALPGRPTQPVPSTQPAADEYGRTPASGGATATTGTAPSAQPAADEYGRTPASGGVGGPVAAPPINAPYQDDQREPASTPGPETATAPATHVIPGTPGSMVLPGNEGIEYHPDGTIRVTETGQIFGTYDVNHPPRGMVPAGTEIPLSDKQGTGYETMSSIGTTGAESLVYGPTQGKLVRDGDYMYAVKPDGTPISPRDIDPNFERNMGAPPPFKTVPGHPEIVLMGADGRPIPTSLPNAASPGSQSGGNLPGDVVPNPDRVTTALNTSRPIDTLAELAAKPGANTQQDAQNITSAIGAMLQGKPDGAWAEPYLNDVARLAWAREERTNGRGGADPRNAPDDYIEHWKDAFFGSDHNVPMVKELDQQMIDYAVDRTPPNKPFDWKQAFGPTGENGLISRQSTGIDCGPNAFATILRSRGYNADPAQTFSFAKQTGYHNGSEFTGPENMANMLRKEAGLDAKNAPIDWNTVNSELDAGRPVILSSDTHYYVVSAKRDGPNGTQYYAGQTAQVAGNPQWSTQGQFRYAGATPNYMITAKGDVDPNSRAVQQLHLQPPATSTGGNREDLSPSEKMNQDIRTMGRQSQPVTTGTTPRMQDTGGGSEDGNPTLQGYQPPDARVQQANQENVWSPNQPARHALMTEFQAQPIEQRQQVFQNAMDQGLAAEGITGADAENWKHVMTAVATGQGLDNPRTAENPDLNPYIIAGESNGNPGTAQRLGASSTGYFQLLHTNRDGSDFVYRGYLPKEYNDNWYDPVGQVRQFVRATVNDPIYRGNPNAVLRDKNQHGSYSFHLSSREPY